MHHDQLSDSVAHLRLSHHADTFLGNPHRALAPHPYMRPPLPGTSSRRRAPHAQSAAPRSPLHYSFGSAIVGKHIERIPLSEVTWVHWRGGRCGCVVARRSRWQWQCRTGCRISGRTRTRGSCRAIFSPHLVTTNQEFDVDSKQRTQVFRHLTYQGEICSLACTWLQSLGQTLAIC